MKKNNYFTLKDDGERMLPTKEGEISFVFLRHKFAYEYVKEYVNGKTVIDIGCGAGYGSKILAERAFLVHGVDYSADAIRFCRNNYESEKIRYFQKSASELNDLDRYDVAVCFQVIEHIESISKFLNRLKKIVKINGKIFITTPNVKKDLHPSKKNPFHVNEMTYKQFNNVLQKYFRNYKLKGIGYASKNKLRSFLGKMPFYRWGRFLKRGNRIKLVVSKAMDMTNFKIIEVNVEENSADLLAICSNDK